MIGCQIWVLITLLIHNSFDGEYYFWKGKYEMSLFLEENPQLLSIFDVRTLQNNNIILDLHNFITIPCLVLGNSRREINDSASFLQRNYNNVYHIEEEKCELINTNQQNISNQITQSNEEIKDHNEDQVNRNFLKNEENFNIPKNIANPQTLDNVRKKTSIENSMNNIEGIQNNKKFGVDSEKLGNIKINKNSEDRMLRKSKKTHKDEEITKEIERLDSYGNLERSEEVRKCEEVHDMDKLEDEENKGFISSNRQRNIDFPPKEKSKYVESQGKRVHLNNPEDYYQDKKVEVNKKRSKNSIEILSDLFQELINEESQLKKHTTNKSEADEEESEDDDNIEGQEAKEKDEEDEKLDCNNNNRIKGNSSKH